jgi:predicted nucleic acid-binding protein
VGREMRIFLDTNIFLAILNEEENWHLAEKILLDSET